MSEDIKNIAKIIERNGGRLYLVGGAVRDKLLNKNIKDEDYCVVGIKEDIFERLFPEAICIGKSFRVYDLAGKEFAMARIDKKNGIGHKGFDVIIRDNITIEEDLRQKRYNYKFNCTRCFNRRIYRPF